ncbi:hypothetical protein BCR44DRAFT_39263, partial [Catenaria anguillulae PL171]
MPETGPSTTTTANTNNNSSGSGSSSKGTTQATQKNEQYVVNNPKLVPGILGGAAVVAIAGMVYIMRPNHPANAAGQSLSPIAVPPKPFNPTTRPPPPPVKKPVARNHNNNNIGNNLHANRSPRPSGSAPGLSPLPHHDNNSLHPSSAAGVRRGVVRKPSSLRMGVSADGTEVHAMSPTSPRSVPGSPHISPLASPSLTPGVVTTKTVDGKLTVSLAPAAAGGTVSPQVSPRLSPMLSPTPTAVATRSADGKLTVTLAGSAPPSPTFSALPSPTLAGPTTYAQGHRVEPAPLSPVSPASISTPPPSAAASATGAPKRNHSIRSHVSVWHNGTDRDSFAPEMLASQSQPQPQPQAYPTSPASLSPSPASSLMMQALMDDLNAAAAAQGVAGLPPALVRQGSQASSVNADGAPVRGTSVVAAKPSHF